jgi:hypothetical protein
MKENLQNILKGWILVGEQAYILKLSGWFFSFIPIILT